jgi:hypothetical protein
MLVIARLNKYMAFVWLDEMTVTKNKMNIIIEATVMAGMIISLFLKK